MNKKDMIDQLEEALKWIEMFKRLESGIVNKSCLNQATSIISKVQSEIAKKEDKYFDNV